MVLLILAQQTCAVQDHKQSEHIVAQIEHRWAASVAFEYSALHQLGYDGAEAVVFGDIGQVFVAAQALGHAQILGDDLSFGGG